MAAYNLRIQPRHTSQSPGLPAPEGKQTQATSWFKSFDWGEGGIPLRLLRNEVRTKARGFGCTTYVHASEDDRCRGSTVRGDSGFARRSPGPGGSPPLRAAAAAGHRLAHAEPGPAPPRAQPARAGATSGSGSRSERGGGDARAGLDNPEAPAGRRGRQVGTSPRAAAARPVPRLQSLAVWWLRGEERGRSSGMTGRGARRTRRAEALARHSAAGRGGGGGG